MICSWLQYNHVLCSLGADLMWSWLSRCSPCPGRRRRRRRWRRRPPRRSRSPGPGTPSAPRNRRAPDRGDPRRSRRTWPARRSGSRGRVSGTPWQSPLTFVWPCHVTGHVWQILSRVTWLTTARQRVSWMTNLKFVKSYVRNMDRVLCIKITLTR